ncbi:MAG: GerMN domain-containing protein [Desulfuromusa sp.]
MSLKLIYLTLIVVVFVAGCQQQPAAPVGSVEANPAYLKYFGDPPQVSKGVGYARVGFFPLLENPQKVRAVPLYLFSENKQLQQILQRVTGGEMIPFLNGQFYHPFSVEDQFRVNPVKDNVLTLEITSKREIRRADLAAIALSLTETALQFSEVKLVQVLVNGEPLPFMPKAGFSHSPEKISAVAPPALLVAAGVWEAGSEDPAELVVNFDRPVAIENIKLTDSSGKKIEGEYFRSVFDMAVVVHPADASLFHEGTKIHIDWDVTDKLGRSNKGSSFLALKRIDH